MKMISKSTQKNIFQIRSLRAVRPCKKSAAQNGFRQTRFANKQRRTPSHCLTQCHPHPQRDRERERERVAVLPRRHWAVVASSPSRREGASPTNAIAKTTIENANGGNTVRLTAALQQKSAWYMVALSWHQIN